ncbi:hypothetical protein AB0I49_05375 [Streptomyces sp. NPDC050617]|uniref:hypothetical protein n=1 Tax=Streptomyces sp. NPDC050617 TaxID=3154628 RepID=UPI0034292932
MAQLEQQSALATHVGNRIFTDEPQYHVPELAERFAYKKDPGSSDTNHEYDSIRV